MKNIPGFILIAIFAWLSSACQHVVFTEPQPAKVAIETEFPSNWQGLFKSIPLPGDNMPGNAWVKVMGGDIYLFNSRMDSVPYLEGDYHHGEAPQVGDSIKVMLRGEMVDAEFASDDWAKFTVEKMEKLGLSDSLILKLTSNWGFLNIQDEQHGKLYWNGIVIEPLRNGDILLWTIENGEEEADKMSDFFAIEVFEDPAYAGKLRVAAPRQKDFIRYVESGGFPDLFMWLSRDYDVDEVPLTLK